MKTSIIITLVFWSILSFGQKTEIEIEGKVVYAPSVQLDGKRMIFQSNRDGAYEIFEAIPEGTDWKIVRKLSIVSGFGSEYDLIGGANLSAGGNKLYFFSGYGEGSSTDIYFSERNEFGFGIPKRLEGSINSKQYEGFPSISPDESTIYFVRINNDIPKSKKRDKDKPLIYFTIYKATKDKDGFWNNVQKLPWPINQESERAPRIMPDGKTLVFSSFRDGSGNYNFYASTLTESGDWSFPVALSSLNTKGSNTFLTVPWSNDKVYYVMDAKKIVSSKIDPNLNIGPTHAFSGTIKDFEIDEGIKSKIRVESMYKQSGGFGLDSDYSGNYYVLLTPGDMYELSFIKEGYKTEKRVIDLKKSKGYTSKSEIIGLTKTSGETRIEVSLPVEAELSKSVDDPEYYALLIGVNDYLTNDNILRDLDNPVADVAKLKEVLTNKYSFEGKNITVLNNASRTDIIDEFENLSSKIDDTDNLLVFYAGHGHWDSKLGVGYWLPSDAKSTSKSNWISNSTVRDYLSGIDSKHTLLISDACFSGSIFKTRELKSLDDLGFSKVYKLKSRNAMTSGTLNSVPDVSKFMEYLVDRLKMNKEKYLTAKRLFFEIETAVINNTSNVPQYGTIQNAGDEGGDFVFIKKQQ